jgi:hypothetical protein
MATRACSSGYLNTLARASLRDVRQYLSMYEDSDEGGWGMEIDGHEWGPRVVAKQRADLAASVKLVVEVAAFVKRPAKDFGKVERQDITRRSNMVLSGGSATFLGIAGSRLLDFFETIGDGKYSRVDMEYLATRSEEQLVSALNYARHYSTAAYILSKLFTLEMDNANPEFTPVTVGMIFESVYLSSIVKAGEGLGRLVGSDPNLVVIMPGLHSYELRAQSGEAIDCASMLDDLEETLARLSSAGVVGSYT